MTFSAANHSIKSISSASTKKLDGANMQHGKVYINELDQSLYVKDIYGNVVRCGNSYRNLEDFPDFLIKERGDNVFVRIVKDDLGELKLGTSVPFIKISSLGNTDLPSIGEGYLGFNSSGQLTSLPDPEYYLSDLADVSNIVKSASRNNWVITWRSIQTTRLQTTSGRLKDAQGPQIVGNWELFPEASNIKDFDNCAYGIEAPYQVFRIRRSTEQVAYLYQNIPFPVSYDANPVLGGDLSANAYSLINQQHSQRTVVPNTAIFTVNITPDIDSMVVIEPTDVVQLITLNVLADSTDVEAVYYVSVVIKNYNGSINFSQNVLFENGVSAITQGKDILLTVTVTVDPNISISVNQKALNLH